jgi:chloramphenicol-sensitive protein RarD
VSEPPDESRRGAIYGALAYLLWGAFPLYWPLLEPAGAVEILAHRMVWSLVVVVLVLTLTRDWQWVRPFLRNRRQVMLLVAAALTISVNWCVYIYGVNSGHVVETSLGYFINPLVTVLLGVVVLGERLRPMQWAAVGVASVAVVLLTVDYGHPPWIALALAFSFGTYGLLKKQAAVGPVRSLTVETAVLFVPATALLVALEVHGTGSFGHVPAAHELLLISTGVVTAVPLLFFGAAAIRVPLTTLGLLQYLAPIFQFLVGVLVYDEQMTAFRLGSFGLVWLALAVFTLDTLRQHRARRPAPTPVCEPV